MMARMSRAFVKDQEDGAAEELSDRPISPHPNHVTTHGLALIDAEIARLQQEQAAATAAQDRGAIARTSRDLRYWSDRRATADVVPPPADSSEARFG
jgi:transcription elongation GreA/GreB family factor